MLPLDSPGFWNVRTENLDTWYLGQETYIRVVDPDGGYNVTEMVAPDNMLYCGLLKDKQKYVASILLMCFREYSSYFAFDLTGVMTNASTVFFFWSSRAQKPHGSSSSSSSAAPPNRYWLAVVVSLVAAVFVQ